MHSDTHQTDEIDRRRHERVSARLQVRISTIEPERDPWTGRPFFRASRETSANVSRGGAFVRTGEPLAPGRRVLVEIVLPTGAPIEAIGRVAWQRRVMTPRGGGDESGVGVEFLGAAAEDFAALEHFLQRSSDEVKATGTDS